MKKVIEAYVELYPDDIVDYLSCDQNMEGQADVIYKLSKVYNHDKNRFIEVLDNIKNSIAKDYNINVQSNVDDMFETMFEIFFDGDMGEVSDGYHTFNQLYHQRAVLFATIVNQNKDLAWKSFKHSDGNYCFDKNGEWFIVGIDTPEGSYTYHYSKEYWNMFNCKELEFAKEWDGHTENDVTRLLSLIK